MGRGNAPFLPAGGGSRSRKGFISFILAAVFLFALIPAAALVSSQKPDLSFENFRAIFAKEVALKQAFYQSSKTVATVACMEARAEEAAALSRGTFLPYDHASKKIQSALSINANLFELELRAQGYDVSFWCGDSDEWTRTAASSEMNNLHAARLPKASVSVVDPPKGIAFCSAPFTVDTAATTITFNKLGFSLYDRNLGMGKAVVFPGSYQVHFGCP